MSFKAGDKVKRIDNKYIERWFNLGETYIISKAHMDDEHIEFSHTGFAMWHSDRFELIEKEGYMEKQFNPKPGDKIICKNGKEYTCCTLEHLQAYGFAIGRHRADGDIFGIGNIILGSWSTWSSKGLAEYDHGWDILEVISSEKEEIVPEEIEVEQLTFTTEDIRKAVIDDLGWQDLSLDLIMKSLQRVTSKEYNEYLLVKEKYLRLKAMFETEDE